MFTLGDIYRYGFGIEQDDATALYWFRQAAEQNHSGATRSLEEMKDSE